MTRLGGFESNLRLFEVVWWISGTRGGIFLSMVANHLLEYAVGSSGRALVVTYTGRGSQVGLARATSRGRNKKHLYFAFRYRERWGMRSWHQ
ncbi:hypothetical protein PBRA_008490 [Plasmodiophora brassicae]|nr:hypothetical protein PBRA_008490 [Plasmodiophora brassicae]